VLCHACRAGVEQGLRSGKRAWVHNLKALCWRTRLRVALETTEVARCNRMYESYEVESTRKGAATRTMPDCGQGDRDTLSTSHLAARDTGIAPLSSGSSPKNFCLPFLPCLSRGHPSPSGGVCCVCGTVPSTRGLAIRSIRPQPLEKSNPKKRPPTSIASGLGLGGGLCGCSAKIW
jgi:hypothetical protein